MVVPLEDSRIVAKVSRLEIEILPKPAIATFEKSSVSDSANFDFPSPRKERLLSFDGQNEDDSNANIFSQPAAVPPQQPQERRKSEKLISFDNFDDSPSPQGDVQHT